MPESDEQPIDQVIGNSSDEEYANTVGYISMKDYAYDKSNPLHYGYFDEIGNLNSEDSRIGEHDYAASYEGIHANANYFNHYYGQNRGNYKGSEFDKDDYDEASADSEDRRQSIILPREYVVNKKAVALYDFVPENDNELELQEGDVVYISYKHGQGWLVAENSTKTRTGLVPEEYVSIITDDSQEDNEDADQFSGEQVRPFYLTQMITQSIAAAASRQVEQSREGESEWEDIDGDEEGGSAMPEHDDDDDVNADDETSESQSH